MSEQNEGESNGDKKVRFGTITLHRTQSNKDRIIEENLKNLEFRSKKKKIAQAHYYGNAGQSPLTRSSTSVINQNKAPVHARLGNGRIRLRRPYSFNDQGIFIKNRRILHINRSGGNIKLFTPGRRTIFKKQGGAQIRLQRIRQQQLPENTLTGTKKIKLRHRRPNLMQPMNYTVEVNNSRTYGNQHISYSRHSIAAQLDKQLQADIKMIQTQNPPVPQLILPIAIPAITFGTTTMTLDHRFSKQDMEHV